MCESYIYGSYNLYDFDSNPSGPNRLSINVTFQTSNCLSAPDEFYYIILKYFEHKIC